MTRGQRRARFGAVVTAFMKRAEMGDTELARRLGVSRLTVRRWREGTTLPREETVRQLQTALHWLDGAGAAHELTNPELVELLVAAGYEIPLAAPAGDRSEQAARCIVYATRYARELFPTGWSTRISEVERSIPGALDLMWGTLPSITRSPEFYVGAYTHDLYQQDQVEAYIALHESRQATFRRRLETAEVRHLYSKKGVEDFLSGASHGEKPAWDFWDVPKRVLAAQLETTVTWLREYPNFEVRLRPAEVPGNLMIVGYDVVLISLTVSSSLMTADNVTGLELIGAEAAVQFTKQFRSYWADQETIKDRTVVIRWLEEQRAHVLASQ